jgi:hypothetical protein
MSWDTRLEKATRQISPTSRREKERIVFTSVQFGFISAARRVNAGALFGLLKAPGLSGQRRM